MADDAVTAADVAAIREREKRATTGPWKWDGDNGTMEAGWDPESRRPVVVFANTGRGASDPTQEDGEFMEAARTDVPRLCDALEAAWAQVERLKAELAAERERCAVIADRVHDDCWFKYKRSTNGAERANPYFEGGSDHAGMIAIAIREQGGTADG